MAVEVMIRQGTILEKPNGKKRLTVREAWYPSDRRVRSRAAERRAAHVAQLVAEGDRDRLAEFDEQALFAALHTCAYRTAFAIRQSNGRSRAEAALWRERRGLIRTWLVTQNMGLTYYCLGRFRGAKLERDDLRGEGLLALIRAVDHFDPWRGVRFSTYAYNAIIRALARVARRSDQFHRLNPASFEGGSEWPDAEDPWTDLYVDRLRHVLRNNLGDLTEREAEVLIQRFPTGSENRQTLERIGADCGLSKERVRQIQNRALRKLRHVLEMDPLLQ